MLLLAHPPGAVAAPSHPQRAPKHTNKQCNTAHAPHACMCRRISHGRPCVGCLVLAQTAPCSNHPLRHHPVAMKRLLAVCCCPHRSIPIECRREQHKHTQHTSCTCMQQVLMCCATPTHLTKLAEQGCLTHPVNRHCESRGLAMV